MKYTAILLPMLIALVAPSAMAEAPAGYYDQCENKSGRQLLQALFSTVGSHTSVGYDGLWNVYETSDVYPDDGKVWDMYSTKHWSVNKNQCGNYKAVGDCYNREHSFPKSWFDNRAPMNADAFHVYPTDGKVNGQRSNYPYGECANGTTVPSSNGIRALGKLGACTFAGYSGTVFEPDDQYKGDFARSYFYMAAAYNDRIDDWSSPMLAGNSYPAFSPWAINLLLKWSRQDPVSKKETDRNDAVYKYQKNRNPFIDHPELAEHIWGDKQNQAWSSGAASTPEFVLPVANSTIDMGTASAGHSKSVLATVKAKGLTADVSVSVAGNGLSVSPSKIPAAQANSADGATITITLYATAAGTCNGTLTLTSANTSTSATIQAAIVDGLPALAPTNVSDRSFTANWTYIGNTFAGGMYQLSVKEPATGLTRTIAVYAEDESYDVDELLPTTQYEYWLESQEERSNVVSLSTFAGIPSIQLLYDGDFKPEATESEPSRAYELLVDAENIDCPINITVSAPFALSSDKSTWTTTLTIEPEEERFYMRIDPTVAGEYETTIHLQAGEYINDAITITGNVYGAEPVVEDFEADNTGCETYDGCNYAGSAYTWRLVNAGIWASDSKYAHNGKQAVRMGKLANSSIAMTVDKPDGIGRVSVYTRKWSANEGDATYHIEYSTDGGATWATAPGMAEVTTTEYTQNDFDVNVAGNARLRVVQTAGARFMIDDLAIGALKADDTSLADATYYSWDAYCRDRQLVIETRNDVDANIYGYDGVMYHSGHIAAGATALSLAPGLYIVYIEGNTRAVMVK